MNNMTNRKKPTKSEYLNGTKEVNPSINTKNAYNLNDTGGLSHDLQSKSKDLWSCI
jgi:hypothetical protein